MRKGRRWIDRQGIVHEAADPKVKPFHRRVGALLCYPIPTTDSAPPATFGSVGR